MPIEAHLLTLSQWLSPAYPVGGFAYSHGLEGAVAMGWVTDGAALEEWLGDVLEFGAGRADALLLAAAYRAGSAEELADVDATARAFAVTKERLFETEQLGAAFCKVTGAVWAADLQGFTYPVAVGRAAALEGIGPVLTAAFYLQAFVSNVVAAGQRLLPLGQTEAQAMLRRLTGRCREIAAETASGDLSLLSGSAFMAEIAAMRHETQHSRIFRT